MYLSEFIASAHVLPHDISDGWMHFVSSPSLQEDDNGAAAHSASRGGHSGG